MANNLVSPQQQLPIDEITSPALGDQILEFCESELFPETAVQNSEVASSSNCCYEEHSSYPTPLSITVDNAAAATIQPPPPPPMLMEDHHTTIEDDISASIDFNLSPPSFSVPQDHHQFYNTNSNNNNNIQDPFNPAAEGPPPLYTVPPMPPPYAANYNIRLRSNSVADPLIGSYLSSSSNSSINNAPFTFDNSWLFTGATPGLSSFLGSNDQELESQGDNGGFFMPADSLARVFNCSTGDLQKTLSSESQHLLNGSPGTTLASEISSLEDPTFKVGKISAEERKRKINRYLKKRNERNFSKKIKYACRKTLADSRPRVRGRFAKNDELGELARSAGGNPQDDDVDDDVRLTFPHHHHKVVKEEGSMDEIDRILTNIDEMNSFKCNTAYTIEPWLN